MAVAVHPHVRGEGWELYRWGDTPDGSPPRAWGRPDADLKLLEPARFTPTCVGKAGRAADADLHAAVHPHVRGEGAGGPVEAVI